MTQSIMTRMTRDRQSVLLPRDPGESRLLRHHRHCPPRPRKCGPLRLLAQLRHGAPLVAAERLVVSCRERNVEQEGTIAKGVWFMSSCLWVSFSTLSPNPRPSAVARTRIVSNCRSVSFCSAPLNPILFEKNKSQSFPTVSQFHSFLSTSTRFFLPPQEPNISHSLTFICRTAILTHCR